MFTNPKSDGELVPRICREYSLLKNKETHNPTQTQAAAVTRQSKKIHGARERLRPGPEREGDQAPCSPRLAAGMA